MATKVEMFRSTSGNVFDSEYLALRDDLRGMLIDSDAINSASADKFVNWVCGDTDRLEQFTKAFGSVNKAHPTRGVADDGSMPTASEFDRIGTNSGHGHAWDRPDGTKARCGGPKLCDPCKYDASLVRLRPTYTPTITDTFQTGTATRPYDAEHHANLNAGV